MDAVPPAQLSESACEALYREHSGRILRLGRYLLRDPQEAQDVAQEVFLKLLRAYPTADARMQWGAWLARVTVNACRDRQRSGWWRWWRAGRDPLPVLEPVASQAGPERVAVDAETRERLWRAFRRLPARQREVALLRFVEGYSTEEIARTLDVTAGTVKRHLFRAVRRLRAALGETG